MIIRQISAEIERQKSLDLRSASPLSADGVESSYFPPRNQLFETTQRDVASHGIPDQTKDNNVRACAVLQGFENIAIEGPVTVPKTPDENANAWKPAEGSRICCGNFPKGSYESLDSNCSVRSDASFPEVVSELGDRITRHCAVEKNPAASSAQEGDNFCGEEEILSSPRRLLDPVRSERLDCGTVSRRSLVGASRCKRRQLSDETLSRSRTACADRLRGFVLLQNHRLALLRQRLHSSRDRHFFK